MGEEKLIKPIIHVPNGVCPRCLTPFTIFESEIVEIELDEDGYPINHDVKYSRLYSKCQSCGLNIKIKKEGLVYKPDCKLLDILDEEYLNYLANKANPFIN